MLNKKITRKEFLKIAGFAIFVVSIIPMLKKFNLFKKHILPKEAKYYKNLAG